MNQYSDLIPSRSMIPKVVDKITLDSWFMNSDSLGYLLQIIEQSFPYRGKKVEKMDYLHIANVAQQTAVELVMNLSYGDLLQLLCENPWMLNTEAELELLEIFEEKLGKATVASVVAVVLCEHFYSHLMKDVECII